MTHAHMFMLDRMHPAADDAQRESVVIEARPYVHPHYHSDGGGNTNGWALAIVLTVLLVGGAALWWWTRK